MSVAKPKPVLPIKRATFDADQIAASLHVPPETAVAKFRDGRVAGQWGEIWGARLYAYTVHGHANVPATDGVVSAEALGDLGISVKSLTANGVKFQQSIFSGQNRPCTPDDLIASISRCDRYVIVDVRAFPVIDFVFVRSTWLLGRVHAGALTGSGWRGNRFFRELEATYELSIEAIDLDVLD